MLANLHAKAQAIIDNYTARGEIIALAESCTGGLVASLLTSIAGSSAVLDRGLVTYSNQSKMDLLGVSADILETHGAVSRECAEAMVRGLLASCPAAAAGVAITGIAGPSGGSAGKPVGLVYIAAMRRNGQPKIEQHYFAGDRQAVQYMAANSAMDALLIDTH
ncbi:MAG TPA: CinA family protein [Alphaproteobacteria bacterium]|mgnify:CR=1 FL=1|nr:damage-inducible protein CinA [Rhodospirillaceae bacterium]HRJ12552.1 CinA family protein [Alphaproteobacteria bacterium]